VRVIDLVRELPRAETRPVGAEFDIAEHTLSTVRHATIAVQAPSRMIWTLRLPARGIIRAWVAVLPAPETREASATFRIGISDHRIYEPLAQQLVTTADSATTGWILVTADLSLYGGRQWSLFHRPDAHPWRVIFNADPGYGRARALWGAPGIDTDSQAARAWREGGEIRASDAGGRIGR
jgi:hypothetical protein